MTDEPSNGLDTRKKAPAANSASRFELIVDVIVFQAKLLLDGLRDVILVPVSIGAGILGLFFGGSDPAQYYRRLLELGRRSETWLNLFGGHGSSSGADDLVDPLKQELIRRSQAKAERQGSQHPTDKN